MPLKTSENQQTNKGFLMFSGGSKGNIGKKRVKINQIRDILNFDDFTVPKIVLDNKVIKKTQTKKDQGNSAFRF